MAQRRIFTEQVIIALIGLISALAVAAITTFFSLRNSGKKEQAVPLPFGRKATYSFEAPINPRQQDQQWLIVLGRGIQADQSVVVITRTSDKIPPGKSFVASVSSPNMATIEAGLAFIETNSKQFNPAETWTQDNLLKIRIPQLDSEGRVLVVLRISGKLDASRPLRINDMVIEEP